MKNGFVIRKPDDFHVHLRDGDMLKQVAPMTAVHFKRALVMPNLAEPVTTVKQAMEYRERIVLAAPRFDPMMSLYLTKDATPDTIVMGRTLALPIKAVKFYPRAGTTNSGHGMSVRELLDRRDIFSAMQADDMVLCLHGENPDYPMLAREYAFLDVLRLIARDFPRLRIVFEHVTTKMACDVVKQFENVAATITLHHLILTTDAVVGDHDCLCMPVAKSERDRLALVQAATSGHPRFFFGSDSAPHSRTAKSKVKGAFGLFTAPVALPALAQVFDKYDKRDRLEDFVSRFGADFYNCVLNHEQVEFVKEDWTVPDPTEVLQDQDQMVRPFMAGETLSWRVRTE